MIYFTADTHFYHGNVIEYNVANRAAGVRRLDVGVGAQGMSPVSIEDILAFWDGDK